jgi:hypothetical protein
MSLEQLWLQKDWQMAALLVAGVILGMIGLRVDSANAWKWYQSQPMTRSIFFILSLFGLGVFVITSAGSSLGTGLVLGLWLGLLLEVQSLLRDEVAFAERFLHDIKPEVREKFLQTWRGKWSLMMWLGLAVLALLALFF